MLSDEELSAITLRRDAALQEVFGLCDGSREWRMCIPVNDKDSDTTICASLRDIKTLIDEVRTLRELTENAIDADRLVICFKGKPNPWYRIIRSDVEDKFEISHAPGNDPSDDFMPILCACFDTVAEAYFVARDIADGKGIEL